MYKNLIKTTCQVLGIEETELMSDSKKHIYSFGRCIISDILRVEESFSIIKIAEILNMHHSSISNMSKLHQNNYATNYNNYRKYYDQVLETYKTISK